MTSPRTLICGSLAFDTIMVFPDRFARHILPEQVHLLSVSFTVGDMRREWGGCAGNIAYNLKAIGGEPVVMATHRRRRRALPRAPRRARRSATDGLRTVPGTFTAQAFIINDLDDNQITAFHPGAMNFSHQNRVEDVVDVALGIVAPDGRDGMQRHVAGFANAGVPFIFDPGQGMPLFSGDDLIEMIDAATYLAVNDYEGRLLCERTGLSLADIGRRVDARGRDAGRRRVADPRRRRGDRDPRRASRSARRPHRLRRRLPRRPPVRHRPRLGLGAHRPPRGGPRRAQDRPSRRAEPRGRPGRRRRRSTTGSSARIPGDAAPGAGAGDRGPPSRRVAGASRSRGPASLATHQPPEPCPRIRNPSPARAPSGRARPRCRCASTAGRARPRTCSRASR